MLFDIKGLGLYPKGHCLVPTGFVLEGFNLGQWVSNQRKARNKMSHERKERLNTLGFVWNAQTSAGISSDQ